MRGHRKKAGFQLAQFFLDLQGLRHRPFRLLKLGDILRCPDHFDRLAGLLIVNNRRLFVNDPLCEFRVALDGVFVQLQ